MVGSSTLAFSSVCNFAQKSASTTPAQGDEACEMGDASGRDLMKLRNVKLEHVTNEWMRGNDNHR